MIDVSWTSTSQFSGYRWVWLDSLVKVQLMKTQNHIRRVYALHLEMEALRWTMESMLQHLTCQSLGTLFHWLFYSGLVTQTTSTLSNRIAFRCKKKKQNHQDE